MPDGAALGLNPVWDAGESCASGEATRFVQGLVLSLDLVGHGDRRDGIVRLADGHLATRVIAVDTQGQALAPARESSGCTTSDNEVSAIVANANSTPGVIGTTSASKTCTYDLWSSCGK